MRRVGRVGTDDDMLLFEFRFFFVFKIKYSCTRCIKAHRITTIMKVPLNDVLPLIK